MTHLPCQTCRTLIAVDPLDPRFPDGPVYCESHAPGARREGATGASEADTSVEVEGDGDGVTVRGKVRF